ncbi:MAG TPA: potassium transporter [Anaerolineae bacterium]|nr:potassium transporter [Caldilineae bacterium]HID35442.1 potassium transporter [Anaerolineae bacterium]HIQ12200.1 potassium transporter [Caldilineales bacterium]
MSTHRSSELAQYSPLARQQAMILVIGFGAIIALGTVLLRLPFAAAGSQPLTWGEAFFISTSATTVTGLVVITPALDLSLFGQFVVLGLMEVGGAGFIAFSVVLFALIGRQVTFAGRQILRDTLGIFETFRVVPFTLTLMGFSIGIQFIGALALWLRWRATMPNLQAFYLALFHSVSAFCNAGFDLFAGTGQNLFGYDADGYTLTVMMLLIIIGGLGILVGVDALTYYWDRRLSLHTRLTLLLTGFLYLAGVLIVLMDPIFEGTTFVDMSWRERFWKALFSVVSARTAGLTIIPLHELGEASILTILISMFIGGAPASMAGGVTLSTIAVLAVTVYSTVRGNPHAVAFGRTLPLETIAKATAIMMVSILLVLVVSLLLLASTQGDFLDVVFEVVSAFSNTGYSLGLTSQLDSFGRLLIAFTMFWGRLGPLTLVVMLAQRERPTYVRYPTEKIAMG